MSAGFVYNSIPYPSLTHPQTHPNSLAVLATVYGMEPARVEKCRVMELGCGNGSNLISLAHGLPESEFLGADLSALHINEAKKTAQELNLDNITFHQLDIKQINRQEFGQFDFIIAHGLYSWVPPDVREKVLEIYREMLSPQGVGYISYNTYPGWHNRIMMRDMMLYHTANIPESTEKVKQALIFLGFLSQEKEGKSEDTLYKEQLRDGFEKLTEHEPAFVLHDILAEFNQPFYFSDFISSAERHGLQFLAESDHFTMSAFDYEPQVRQVIQIISNNDIIRREQYLDFLRCRYFRQTLVCHREIQIDHNVLPEKLHKFRIVSRMIPVSDTFELSSPKAEQFKQPMSGAKIEVEHPLCKAALYYLEKIWAHSANFEDLMARARELLIKDGYPNEISEEDEQTAASFLMQTFFTGLIELRLYEPQFATEPGERPLASNLARWQALRTSDVTSLCGKNFKLEDSFTRNLLLLLDGTRDRTRLLAELTAKIEAGEMLDENEEARDLTVIKRDLPEVVESNLVQMARSALLVS
jgi:methyltransferase-like protein/ubiquinone/menaquinone biosynthesis C-methylase UbiE